MHVSMCIFLSGKLKKGKHEYTLPKSVKMGNKVFLFIWVCFFISCLLCRGHIFEKWSVFIEGGDLASFKGKKPPF